MPSHLRQAQNPQPHPRRATQARPPARHTNGSLRAPPPRIAGRPDRATAGEGRAFTVTTGEPSTTGDSARPPSSAKRPYRINHHRLEASTTQSASAPQSPTASTPTLPCKRHPPCPRKSPPQPPCPYNAL